tara:strand:+ start:5507 stop:6352 length:846 start_codon:yes stop_codon:yes gene_type:complete
MATRIIPLLTQQKNHTMQAPPSYQSLLQKISVLENKNSILEQKISDLENKNSILENKLKGHNISSNIQQCTNPTSNLLSTCVREQYELKQKRNIWENSPFQLINHLECDDVGRIGEIFIQKTCDDLNIPASINGTLTKAIGGGKIGDGTINGHSAEVKTARQGTGKAASCQHELGEIPWNAEFMCFLDVGPSTCHLHILPNYPEDFYRKSGQTGSKLKCHEWGFPTKKITHRKNCGAYKFDTTEKLNKTASKKHPGYTFCITHPEGDETLAQFINRIIPDE